MGAQAASDSKSRVLGLFVHPVRAQQITLLRMLVAFLPYLHFAGEE